MKKALLLVICLTLILISCSCGTDTGEVAFINGRYPKDIFRIYDPSTVVQFDSVVNEENGSTFHLKAGTSKSVNDIAEYYSILLQNASLTAKEQTEETFTMTGEFYGYSFAITADSHPQDQNFNTVYCIELDSRMQGADDSIHATDPSAQTAKAGPKEFEVIVNGFSLNGMVSVAVKNGLLYVPLSDIVQTAGGFSRLSLENGVEAMGGYLLDKGLVKKDFFVTTGKLALTQYADNRNVELNYLPYYENGEIFVPYTMLADLFGGATVSVDFVSRQIIVQTGSYFNYENPVYQTNNDNIELYRLRDPAGYGDNGFSDKVNGLGGDMDSFTYTAEEIASAAEYYVQAGYKRINATINTLDGDWVTWNDTETVIPEGPDALLAAYHDAGLKVTYNLIFWDKDLKNSGEKIDIPRFQTEESIERYLDFVDRITTHFKGRVDYYEFWNESDIENTIQWIPADTYVEAAKKIIPIIRKNDPHAQIIVGATGYDNDKVREYVKTIISSDLMPLVDGVSIHAMYGTSPDWQSEYYYKYDEYLTQLKQIAADHGFTGEFIAEEVGWGLLSGDPDTGANYLTCETENIANKYLIRGLTINRGLGFSVENCLRTVNGDVIMRRLGSFYAGVAPYAFGVQIDTDIPLIRHYEFIDENGNPITAIWNDDSAHDEIVAGNLSKVTIRGMTADRITAVDLLNGLTCKLNFDNEDGNIVINDLYISDNPVFLVIEQE
jgi:hypothetical protein